MHKGDEGLALNKLEVYVILKEQKSDVKCNRTSNAIVLHKGTYTTLTHSHYTHTLTLHSHTHTTLNH